MGSGPRDFPGLFWPLRAARGGWRRRRRALHSDTYGARYGNAYGAHYGNSYGAHYGDAYGAHYGDAYGVHYGGRSDLWRGFGMRCHQAVVLLCILVRQYQVSCITVTGFGYRVRGVRVHTFVKHRYPLISGRQRVDNNILLNFYKIFTQCFL